MNMTPNNPILAWLFENETPPPHPSLTQIKEAVTWIEGERRRAWRRFLHHAPCIERYKEVAKLDLFISSVIEWGQFCFLYRSAKRKHAMNQYAIEVMARIWRVQTRTVKKGSPGRAHLQHLLRNLKRAKSGQKWIDMVARGLAREFSAKGERLEREHNKLLLDVYRLEARQSRKQSQTPGVLIDHWPADAAPALEAEARLAAQRRQERGYLFQPTQEPGAYLSYMCRQEDVRERIWRLQQKHVAVTPELIDDMRQLRQKTAEHYGFSDIAAYQMSNMHVLTPKRAERWLRKSLKQMMPALNKAVNKATDQLDVTQPWNQKRAALLGANQRLSRSISPKAFPWRSTAVKIFEELFAMAGWTSQRAPKIVGKGAQKRLMFSFQHSNGRHAQVWYAPFDPQPNENSTVAAQASVIHAAPEYAEQSYVCLIEHFLSPGRPFFSLDSLEYLCHEIGHVLHYLALPYQRPYEDRELTDDIIEIPSILLEVYWRDPDTLARWTSRQAPAALRDPRYWKRRLKLNAKHAYTYQRHLARAYLDLRLHMYPHHDLEEERKQVSAFWTPWHEEMKEDLNFFEWGSFHAMAISHLMGRAVARRLAPLRHDGSVASEDVAEQFKLLLDYLGERVENEDICSQWRKLAGETFRESVERGFEDWGKFLIRKIGKS